MASINETAKTLKSLHQPGSPIVFSNIWDIPSLNALLSLNDSPSKPVKAVATASWAIAASYGINDEDLSMEQNLQIISKIGPICAKANIPLSVDLQDGYGSNIEAVVAAAVKAGAVGANIEDSIPSAGFDKGISGSLYGTEDQVKRLKLALQAAKNAGCPDFVLNARCDVFRLDDSSSLDDETRMKEAIKRGKAFLEAGVTTIFYWGGRGKGLRTDIVEKLVKELDGRVAVLLAARPGAHTVEELGKIGVARISVGPSLFLAAMEAFKKAASKMLGGGGLAA
ncbi:hypothetical protein PT974_07184 [Cladobotryum mycophilum]|uniref:Carboxyphosphonoenolpyruvate phosphonomutase-like protein n=1 Tax=Cladobotryum mycophilum TaxID=491253 RepID=A0ABR0SNN1_9HYPO